MRFVASCVLASLLCVACVPRVVPYETAAAEKKISGAVDAMDTLRAEVDLGGDTLPLTDEAGKKADALIVDLRAAYNLVGDQTLTLKTAQSVNQRNQDSIDRCSKAVGEIYRHWRAPIVGKPANTTTKAYLLTVIPPARQACKSALGDLQDLK